MWSGFGINSYFCLSMLWKNAKAKNARTVKKQMIPKVGHENLIILITV
jgi:hypothetical protein